MTEAEFSKKLQHYRISKDEHAEITKLLGHAPEGIEWALFSALWSEHCSYKSSKIHLRKLGATLNNTVINAEGENAGVVDLGFGERVVFKMESHNHPSFIEPYQGAATGVGGILRDIFTMGARPIALADFLCFGEVTAPRMEALVKGVVKGISGYGNCVGVPTITGQTEFDASYNNNILVNAMAVGLLRPGEEVALSAAAGPGNWVVYVGAKTGKDGVHGAAMASESFDDNSEKKKPNVQIGDPYFEKLLIESCFEVLQRGLVVSIQDMGAAGLTSSSFEMASKGRVGMRLNLSQVPLRDPTMTAEEILLSESQERMLLICLPEKFSAIQQVFARWGLDAVQVGEVLSERKVELFWKNEKLCSLDPDILVEQAPKYQRPYSVWTSRQRREAIQEPKASVGEFLARYFSSPQGSLRTPIYRQYDQRVGALTAKGAESAISFQRMPDSGRGLAMAVGCKPQVMKMDARLGALDAVFYPALQMAIKGARALAVTDCLNFANPEKPEVMSEFVASVEAIVEAAKSLATPVVSGNVSFYNETLGQGITSTPATGLLGIRDNVENIPEDVFVQAGNPVFLVGFTQVVSEGIALTAPSFSGEFNVEKGRQLLEVLWDLGKSQCVVSSRMSGRGGLSVALVKMTFGGQGISFETKKTSGDLIHEKFYQALFEVDLTHQDEFLRKLKRAEGLGIECERLGVVVSNAKLDFGALGNFDGASYLAQAKDGFLKKLEN
jgi:phosphoribosylformylglycinamidine synthase subunit PurL